MTVFTGAGGKEAKIIDNDAKSERQRKDSQTEGKKAKTKQPERRKVGSNQDCLSHSIGLRTLWLFSRLMAGNVAFVLRVIL